MAISSVEDMEILFADIPLDQVSVSMTINSPAPVLFAMYLVVAEGQRVGWDQLSGTLQNDILKEYGAQKELQVIAHESEIANTLDPRKKDAKQHRTEVASLLPVHRPSYHFWTE